MARLRSCRIAEKLEEVIELMQSRGIAVQTMPRAKRISCLARDLAVSQRPGCIWRDRGWLGFLESAVALTVGLAVLFVTGFFSDLPTPLGLVVLAFLVVVSVCGWFAGYRLRNSVPR